MRGARFKAVSCRNLRVLLVSCSSFFFFFTTTQFVFKYLSSTLQVSSLGRKSLECKKFLDRVVQHILISVVVQDNTSICPQIVCVFERHLCKIQKYFAAICNFKFYSISSNKLLTMLSEIKESLKFEWSVLSKIHLSFLTALSPLLKLVN